MGAADGSWVWGRWGTGRGALPVVAIVVLGMGVASASGGSVQEPARRPGGLQGLVPIEAYVADGDWQAVLREGRTRAAFSEPGTDEWFSAWRWIIAAHEGRGEFEELERAARTLLDRGARIQGAPPWESGAVRRELSVVAASSLFEVRFYLARRLQGQGLYAEALGHLQLLIHETRRGIPLRVSREAVASIGVEAGRCLMALGRWDEARSALDAAREVLPGEPATAIGEVWLASLLKDRIALWGSLAQHPRPAVLERELGSLLTRAGSELARRLEVEPGEIPRVVAGFAELEGGRSPSMAFTSYDPRRPNLPATLVLSRGDFAIGRAKLEAVLVHELAHAWLWTRLGREHDALPAWLSEGLAQALVGELELTAERIAHVLLARGDGRADGKRSADGVELDFGSDRTNEFVQAAGPLQVLLLAQAQDGQGVRRFVEAIEQGARWRAALQQVSGLEQRAYRAPARELARSLVADKLREAGPRVGALEAVRERGHGPLLELAEEQLAQPLDPVSRAFALRARARGLQGAGRFDEAERAWAEVAHEAWRFPTDLEEALLYRAGCLLRLGRTELARPLLFLVREAGRGDIPRREAAELLERSSAR